MYDPTNNGEESNPLDHDCPNQQPTPIEECVICKEEEIGPKMLVCDSCFTFTSSVHHIDGDKFCDSCYELVLKDRNTEPNTNFLLEVCSVCGRFKGDCEGIRCFEAEEK